MEMKSPPPCPGTVTVRRNPPRKARATPSSAIPLRGPLSSPSISRDIFSTDILQNPNTADDSNSDSSTRSLSENLKVFLRIRPMTVQKNSKSIAESKNAWPKNPKTKSNSRPKTKKSSEICVQVNEDLRSVTVSTPQPLQEVKRIKSEVYEGFSRVFASEVSQTDVYEEMVKPLVEDFLKGKSGMLAAMGPSGSGKTHTVFGCAREPGMVPLALRHIFSENESSATHSSRVFYLSMFEISSERGKAERMVDLLHDASDISMQHSVIKGLQEAMVHEAQQAESLIARGMLKRATAMTNSNSQSSRSQCIINIRRDSMQAGEEVDGNASSTMLTIVDLAGAEREKKTGNQGARLLESNFINNTSMVFGQCLRSLLEHQRNRNKPLQKHYKNSLLTRYLQDYLGGKKRMMLILTIKPGVEDYLDTSFLLRQASPFTKIKFKTMEEPGNLSCNKRPNQALAQAGQLKKMKLSNKEASLIDEENIDRGFHLNLHKEIAGKVIKGSSSDNVGDIHDEKVNEIHVLSDGFEGLGIREKSFLKGGYNKPNIKKDREYQIMQGLSKALWTVLKQYKEKLEGAEKENHRLRDSLANEKTRSLELENELNSEKMRLLDLENELNELKSQCTYCRKASDDVFPVSTHDASFNLSQHEMAELPEVNSEILFSSSRELGKTENKRKTDTLVKDSVLTFASCAGGDEECYPQQLQDLLESSDDTENTKGDPSEVAMSSRSQVLSTSTSSLQDLVCHEHMGIVDMPSINQATSQLTSESLYTSGKSEQDALNIVGDVKNLEPKYECASGRSCLATTFECESAKGTQNYEDLKDAQQEATQLKNGTTGSIIQEYYPQQLEGLLESCDDTENTKGDTSEVAMSSRSQVLSTSTSSSQDLVCHEDMGIVDMPSRSQATSQSKSGSLYTSDKSEQGAFNIVGDVKNLEPESECGLGRSCLSTTFECESAKSNQNYEELKDAKQDATQLENGLTDDGLSLIDERIVTNAAHSHTVLNSSEGPQKDDTCYHVDEEQLNKEEGIVSLKHEEQLNKEEGMVSLKHEEQLNKEEGMLEPLLTIPPEEEWDAKNMRKFVPEVSSCSNIQLTEKPKRRLQPASSVLLKDISLLDIKDENDKPKGARIGKRVTMDDRSRTQGSLSLLNLLTSKLDR